MSETAAATVAAALDAVGVVVLSGCTAGSRNGSPAPLGRRRTAPLRGAAAATLSSSPSVDLRGGEVGPRIGRWVVVRLAVTHTTPHG